MGRDDTAYGDLHEPEETCFISMLLVSDQDGFVGKTISFEGFLNGVPASFFFSNCSSHSFVRAQAMERAGLQLSSTVPKRCQQLHFPGEGMPTLGTVVSPFRIQEYSVDNFEFQVLPTISTFDVVLGGDWLRGFNEFTLSANDFSFPHNGEMISLRVSTARRKRTD